MCVLVHVTCISYVYNKAMKVSHLCISHHLLFIENIIVHINTVMIKDTTESNTFAFYLDLPLLIDRDGRMCTLPFTSNATI